MAYDAGTAFLQIVPSFRGIQDELKTASAKLGSTLSAAVADALPKGFAEGAKKAEAQAADSGRTAGERFAGALNKQIRESAQKAARQLPDIKLRLNPEDIDRDLEAVRVRLAAIGDQNIDIDFDTHGLWAELYKLRSELTAMQRQASDRIEIAFDTHAAAEALKTIDTMFDDIDRRGMTAWGKFSKGFNDAAKSAKLTIPELDASTADDSTRAMLQELHTDLERLGRIKINVDVDEDTALAEMRAAMAKLEAIARDSTLRQLRGDAGDAATTLRGFLGDEQQQEKAGADAGDRIGGALVAELRKIMAEASAAIGDIDIDVDIDAGSGAAKLAVLKRELQGLSAQIDLGMEPGLVIARLKEVREEIQEIQRTAGNDIELNFDTDAAARALQRTRELERKAELAGLRVGGAFNDGFQQRISGAEAAIGDVRIGANSTGFDRRLVAVKDALLQLKDQRIGVDLDIDEARRRAAALERELIEIAKNSPVIHQRYDAEQARKQLHEFAEMAKSVAEQIDEAHVDALKENAERDRQAGADAGNRIGGALVAELKKIMAEASAAIGDIDVDVDIDAGSAAAKLAVLKNELKDLGALIDLGMEPGLVIARLKEVREEIEAIQRTAGNNIELNFDTDAAARALQRTRELERKAELAGLRAGGAFNDGFQQRISGAESAIGDVRIGANSTGFDQRLVAVKDALLQLKDQRIGVDLDVDEARRKASELERELQDIANNSPVVHQRYDAEQARKQLHEFADMAKSVAEQIDEAHAEALKVNAERDLEAEGKKAAGSFLDGFRAAIKAGQERIPDLQVDADSSKADKALADIKRRMAALGDKKIGVDISAEDATKQLRILQARLHALSQDKDIDVQLRVDASAARRDIDRFFADTGSDTDKFDAKMRAAMDNIPQGLESVRRSMEQIREARVNLDIDDEQAQLRIAKVREELTRLAATSPEVQVRVDAMAALAQLKLVQAEADKTGRSIDRVGVLSGGGIGRLAGLVLAGAALGSVVAPAAAAAAVAIGGIAAAAGVAVAGIGVLALGLFGITDAVQALNKAQEDQAKTAKSLGASNKAMATAQDQLRTAEQSLSAARENAADAAISSEQRLSDARENAARRNVDASRQLKDAQDAEKDSRLALNDAIKQAEIDMAGLDLQVRKNSLSQRDATAAIAEERLKLQKVLSDPKATALERERAQIAFDERVFQLKELKYRGEELRKQQREYAKDGVEASDKVKAARKRQAQDQQRVNDAEADTVRIRKDGVRSIADAQRAQVKQQRDSTRAITAAQQQVVAANRAIQQSSLAAAAGGGEAMNNLQTAMEKLSPAGQRFARFIFGLKDEFRGLTDAASTGLMPGLTAGIQSLTRNLAPLQGFIAKMAAAIGGLFAQFAAGMRSPLWQNFFGYLDEIAVPTMQAMFDIAGNVGGALAALFLAMKPFNTSFLQGLVDATQSFSDWAQKLTRTHEYRDFLEYVARVGPKVVELIKNMGAFIGKIVIAAAPIGEQVIDMFSDLFGWLSRISTINWTAFLSLLAIFAGAAGTIAGVVGAARKLYLIFLPIIGVTKTLWTWLTAKLIPAFKSGKVSASTFGTALSGATVKAGAAALAIAAVAAVLLSWYTENKEQEARVDDLADALTQLGKAYEETGSLTSDMSQETIAANKNLRDMILTCDKYGISLDKVAKAATGNQGAQSSLLRQYDEQIKALKERAAQEKRPIISKDSNPFSKDSWDITKRWNHEVPGMKTLDEAGSLQEQRDSLQKQFEETRQLERAERALAAAEEHKAAILNIKAIPATIVQTAKLEKNQTRIDELNQMLINNQTKEGQAANAVKFFSDELDKQSLKARTATDSAESFASGIINLRDQVTSAKDAHDKHATSVEFDSKNLEKNSATALANRDAIQALAAQSRDAFLADIAAGVGVDTARKAHEKRIEALKNEAHNLDINETAVQDLIDTQGKIDENITTKYNSQDFDKVYNELFRLNFMQEMIKMGKTSQQAEAAWGDYQNRMLRGVNAPMAKVPKGATRIGGKGSTMAAGGPVRGPGTKTSDDVPIWGSAGEFMQRAAAVDYYGPAVMHAMNDMRIPKQVFGYAGGGLIHDVNDKQFRYAGGGTMPVVVDYGAMTIEKPTKAEAEQIVMDEMGGYFDAIAGGVASGSLEVARIAEATARRMRATDKQLVALMEAGLVESGMRNLSYGDRDSVGFLQQRAGWGSVAQRMNVDYATRKFIDKAKRVDKANYTAGELAQAVQVSAFPSRYEQRLADAVAVIDRESPYLKGYGEGIGVRDGGRGWRWQMQVLRRVFPALALISGYRPGSKTLSGNLSMHAIDGGRAVDVTANRNVARYIHDTFGKRTVELITPWREYNLWHGKPHQYSAAVERQHGVGAAGNDHVHWAFDDGGWLPPGYGNVVNATGKPEAVFTASQFQDIKSLAEATRASVMNTNNNTSSGATYQFDFGNSTLTGARLEALQRRQESLARVARPNY